MLAAVLEVTGLLLRAMEVDFGMVLIGCAVRNRAALAIAWMNLVILNGKQYCFFGSTILLGQQAWRYESIGLNAFLDLHSIVFS